MMKMSQIIDVGIVVDGISRTGSGDGGGLCRDRRQMMKLSRSSTYTVQPSPSYGRCYTKRHGARLSFCFHSLFWSEVDDARRQKLTSFQVEMLSEGLLHVNTDVESRLKSIPTYLSVITADRDNKQAHISSIPSAKEVYYLR